MFTVRDGKALKLITDTTPKSCKLKLARESMKYEHLKTCTELDHKISPNKVAKPSFAIYKFVCNESELFIVVQLTRPDPQRP